MLAINSITRCVKTLSVSARNSPCAGVLRAQSSAQSSKKLLAWKAATSLLDGKCQIVGTTLPNRCAAIINDGDNSLAVAVRRRRDTLVNQLLIQLDAVLAKAYDEDALADKGTYLASSGAGMAG
ncbi:MAG: hypothetical protein WC657_05095 [Candidatus Paceibacterota bacterium]|jgi:hypothetical protein